jgi:enamine deaminase RidA (YjgF/YER057c/UK114 family)
LTQNPTPGLQFWVYTPVKILSTEKDWTKFGQINEVYGRYFTSNPPARETVEVARLPKDVRVEISCIAYK